MENNNNTDNNSAIQMEEDTQEPYSKFDAGDAVILHSLVQSTHMNGRRGIIHHYPIVSTADIPMDMDPNPSEPRCMVRLFPETTNSSSNNSNSITSSIIQQCISIKTKNMTLDYPPGQEVKLYGLVGAKHFNGRIATIVSFRVVKKNGKREPRYLVEIPVHDDDYKKDDGDNVDETKDVKQILVSPKNLIHLPEHKPPPVPVLDQRLVFTGSMKSIVKVLNQSVHRIPTHDDLASMRGFHLLSNEGLMPVPLADNGAPDQAALQRRMAEDAIMAKLWGKIPIRTYKSKGANTDEEDDETEGNNHLPPSYQRLQSICPTMGRIHKICFNPKCYKVIQNPTSKQSKMKRCTNCNAVAYCNRECALEAWGYHRKTCKAIQNDNVRFADYVTLSSPQREEVVQTQRMVRLCVNRIAGSDNVDSYFQSNLNPKEESNGSNTAKLIYDVMTQLGPEISNEILQMVENAPSPNREVTVAIGFNSLGSDPIYSTKDIQLLANVHDCSVTYQQQQQGTEKKYDVGVEDEKKVVYNDIVQLEPNGEELPRGGNMMGNIPEDVQDGFFNFMNNLPGGMGVDIGGPGDGAPGGGAQFFMPGQGGIPGPMGNNMGAAAEGGAAQFFIPAPQGGMPPPGMMMGNINAAGGGQFFMPGQGVMPPANANVPPPGNNDDIPEMGEGGGADNGDANAAAAGVPQPQNVPPALANFLQHVLAEAGVGPLPGADNAGGNDDDDTGDNGDDNLPQVEDVADNNPNQPPPPQQGNFQFGGAHVHVAQVNANEAPPGAPPMPQGGAFFQVPGMPVGVQVAVAQAGPGDDDEGIAAMPELAGMMQGGWLGPGFALGGEGIENDMEDIVEGEMQIED